MTSVSATISQTSDTISQTSDIETTTSVPDTDWVEYYTENGIEVVAVDSNVLYEYGAYYTGQTVSTAFVVADKTSGLLKGKTDNNDSYFFSVVASFSENSEISNINKNDVVVVIGIVEEPPAFGSTTVTLNDAHIVSIGETAKKTLQEYVDQRDLHTEYARSLKEAAEAAAEQQANDDRDAYINNCIKVDYGEVERNPDKFKGTSITFSGEVIQVSEGWFDSVTLRIKSGKNIWYVTYYRSEGESRILEGDKVTVYGECTGVTTYTSVIGNSVTLPSVRAKYLSVK